MEQFIYTVDQAATALGFKRTHLYELMANGMLAFFKDGKRRYITKSSRTKYTLMWKAMLYIKSTVNRKNQRHVV